MGRWTKIFVYHLTFRWELICCGNLLNAWIAHVGQQQAMESIRHHKTASFISKCRNSSQQCQGISCPTVDQSSRTPAKQRSEPLVAKGLASFTVLRMIACSWSGALTEKQCSLNTLFIQKKNNESLLRFLFFFSLCHNLKKISFSGLENFKLCSNRCIPVMGKNIPAVVSHAVTCF